MSVQLLSTALLDHSLIERAAEEGVVLDAVPFIETPVSIAREQRQEIEELFDLPITAVFTSANAVRAVAGILGVRKPGWTIYCNSGATSKAVYKYFDIPETKRICVADNAAALAETIIDDDIREVVFFCGDKRLDTLPGTLLAENISVHEQVVYNTIETPHTLKKPYDGILFFSPSAVSSYLSVNAVRPGTVLFAVGDTTGSAVRDMTGMEPVIGTQHSKESLVEEAIQYFHKQASVMTGK